MNVLVSRERFSFLCMLDSVLFSTSAAKPFCYLPNGFFQSSNIRSENAYSQVDDFVVVHIAFGDCGEGVRESNRGRGMNGRAQRRKECRSVIVPRAFQF